MNEISLHCHLLYFSSIILSFGHCVKKFGIWIKISLSLLSIIINFVKRYLTKILQKIIRENGIVQEVVPELTQIFLRWKCVKRTDCLKSNVPLINFPDTIYVTSRHMILTKARTMNGGWRVSMRHLLSMTFPRAWPIEAAPFGSLEMWRKNVAATSRTDVPPPIVTLTK